MSHGRSSLDAPLGLRDMVHQCCGRPLLRADRSPSYDWPLELREFSLLKYRTSDFARDFHITAPLTKSDHGSTDLLPATTQHVALTPSTQYQSKVTKAVAL